MMGDDYRQADAFEKDPLDKVGTSSVYALRRRTRTASGLGLTRVLYALRYA